MSKAAEMAKVSARGGFHLLWGLILSTAISAVGTIFIARLLGADNMGLYTIALAAPNLIATFRDWGVTTAMIKYSAQYNSEGDIAKIRSIFISGIIFEVIVGSALSIVAFFLSGFLANLYQRPTIVPLIQISALFILTSGLVGAATAAFTGLERLHLNSVMLVIQSIVKAALIIGLVLLGLGTLGAVTGFAVSVLVAAIAGIVLTWTMYRTLPHPHNQKLQFYQNTKIMLKYGLPLSVAGILSGFLAQFYSTIMAIYVTNNASIGNYSVASNFVVLITFFATPVTTMLFPAFSKLDHRKDKDLLKNVFQASVKYASLVVVPVTIMVMALASPAISTLFENNYQEAPLFLALLSISYLYTAMGNLSVGNLLNGQGYTNYNFKLNLLNIIIGFPLSFILISKLGIFGLILTSLLVGLPSFFISLGFIKKHFDVSVDWVSSAKILFSSAAAGVLTFILNSYLPFSNLMKLIIGVIVFVVSFVIILLATQTVTQLDINNLKEVVRGLGPLRKPLDFILTIIEKLMIILKFEKKTPENDRDLLSEIN